MFKRKKERADTRGLEGIVTFYNQHNALHAERVLKWEGLKVALVPGPREISPNCGVALRFEHHRRESVERLFKENGIQYEAIQHYPET
jgi:hypothetical protein